MIVGRHIKVAYTTTQPGVMKHWIADNERKYPVLVKGETPPEWISAFNHNWTFTIDRVLQLPLTNIPIENISAVHLWQGRSYANKRFYVLRGVVLQVCSRDDNLRRR
jgi:hypothetical protein